MQVGLFESKYVVEAEDGRLFSVPSTYWNEPGRVMPQRVKDYMAANPDMYYIAKSAMHKEVRRGDFARARAFALQMERFKKGSAKQYLRKMIAEESRSLYLLRAYNDGLCLQDMLQLFCRTAKDWEVGSKYGICFSGWYEVARGNGWYGSYEEGWTDQYAWPDNPETEIRKWVAADRLDKIMELAVMATCGSPGADPARRDMRQVMVELAAARLPKWAETLESFRVERHHEEVIILAEIVCGMWNEDACNHLGTHVSGTAIDIPVIRPYVNDPHTRPGKAWFKKNRHRLAFGVPMPPDADFRWSGRDAGTLWRYLAFHERGTCDVPWEQVTPDDNVQALYSGCYKEKFE